MLGGTFDEDVIDGMMAEADTSNDGRISFKEFAIFMKQGANIEAAIASNDVALDSHSGPSRSFVACSACSCGEAECRIL